MKASRTLAAAVLATTALLTGCASTSSQPYNNGFNSGYNTVSMGYGTIESIQVVQGENRTSGAGAILGGVVGALAGNQVGSGSGRTAATVAGGVAGRTRRAEPPRPADQPASPRRLCRGRPPGRPGIPR